MTTAKSLLTTDPAGAAHLAFEKSFSFKLPSAPVRLSWPLSVDKETPLPPGLPTVGVVEREDRVRGLCFLFSNT